ncbi:hypothetical protein RB195_016704 [Necator americanus]|uniref:Reverse transcriptase domain-containing protein n=1 Tax=Necator americanus TaxID=51031 RepID=A0ABR1C1Q3_NECAM
MKLKRKGPATAPCLTPVTPSNGVVYPVGVRTATDSKMREEPELRRAGVTGVRQGAVAGPFLFNFAIDDIMRRTVDQCPADIVLAPSGCPLTDLDYADNVVAAAYRLRHCPDKYKQMWISSRPRMRIRVDGQLIELVHVYVLLLGLYAEEQRQLR